METNVNYTVVGAFVLFLTGVLIIAVIWLSSGISVVHYNTYTVYMSESVSGLSSDAVVEFNGVNVGNVSSIEIDEHNPHVVILQLQVKKSTPISRGTRATLSTKGLTGITFLALVDQGKDLRPLEKIPGEPYPVIYAAPSFLGRIDTLIHKLVDNFSKVSTSIQRLLDDENLSAVREILIDMRHVSRTLASNTSQMQTIINNTARASNQFSPLILNTMSTMRTMSSQILPATNQLMMNLNTMTSNLSAISMEIKSNPAVLIRGRTPQRLGPGER